MCGKKGGPKQKKRKILLIPVKKKTEIYIYFLELLMCFPIRSEKVFIQNSRRPSEKSPRPLEVHSSVVQNCQILSLQKYPTVKLPWRQVQYPLHYNMKPKREGGKVCKHSLEQWKNLFQNVSS